jgi:adenylylsulfate kinase
MIIDRQPREIAGVGGNKSPRSADIHREDGSITRGARESRFGHRAVTVWCTGLSGSGKSTLAKALEARMFNDSRPVYRLDGDNLRFGINHDLGFSKEDRRENVRRAAEVAKLFNDAGVSVICSLISPMREDRERAREIVGSESFVEVYLSAPIDECERRDPHGLYKKARAGEISEFTGVSAPYEAPESPDLELDTSKLSVDECVESLLNKLGS